MPKKLEALTVTQIIESGYNARTVDGRPLYELAAPDYIISQAEVEGVPFQVTKSSLRDSRQGHDVHVSAFKAVGNMWPQILSSLAWIRNNYYGNNPPLRSSVEDFIHMAAIGKNAVLFLLNRADNPILQDNIPNIVGHVHKVAAGLQTEAQTHQNSLDSFPADDELYLSADLNGRLHAVERSCPAPKSMITEASSTLFSGSIELVDQQVMQELDHFFPDFGRLRDFSDLLLKDASLEHSLSFFLLDNYVTRAGLEQQLRIQRGDQQLVSHITTSRQKAEQQKAKVEASRRLVQKKINKVLGRRQTL